MLKNVHNLRAYVRDFAKSQQDKKIQVVKFLVKFIAQNNHWGQESRIVKSGHQQLEGFSNLFKAQLFFTFLIRPSQGACPLLPSFLLRHSQRLSLVLIYSIQLKLKEAGRIPTFQLISNRTCRFIFNSGPCFFDW